MKTVEQITLHCTVGTSDKIYKLKLIEMPSGFRLDFWYGRRGANLRTGTKFKEQVLYYVAKEKYDELVKQKLGKGYVIINDWEGAASSSLMDLANTIEEEAEKSGVPRRSKPKRKRPKKKAKSIVVDLMSAGDVVGKGVNKSIQDGGKTPLEERIKLGRRKLKAG